MQAVKGRMELSIVLHFTDHADGKSSHTASFGCSRTVFPHIHILQCLFSLLVSLSFFSFFRLSSWALFSSLLVYCFFAAEGRILLFA